MIKKVFYISIIILTLVFLFILNFNVYIFSPEICNVLLQKSPIEFCEEKGRDTLIQDNYIYSNVDKKGNLILILSDAQKSNWKHLVLNNETNNKFRNYGDVEISDDYTKCTFKCYKETAVDNAFSFVNALFCVFIQAIEGKKSEDIRVECVFIDAVTNEVKYHVVFPDSELEFNIDPDVFSSRNKTGKTVRQGTVSEEHR